MIVKLKQIKRVWTKNGMKQIINTPHKTFNKKTNCIDNYENMISKTQISKYIRAYNDIKCNYEEYKPGYLQNYDLNGFSGNVIEYIHKQDKSCKFWISNFYIDDLFCTMVLNENTMDLKVFDFTTNYKQRKLIKWLIDYMFEIIEI